MADADIRARITAQDEASSKLKELSGHLGGVKSALGDVMKTALGFDLGTIIAKAGDEVHKMVSEAFVDYNTLQEQIAQTNAVLKSTGGVAGVTASQVRELADAFENTTKFSDDQVQSAENILLTFTKIGKDVFPQATETVLNMAQALGEDTKSASIQLGKALQDPILGVTALRRVGVNFNSSQQEVIKKMVETGHSADAQKAILKELQTEFGNSAKAAGTTFAGRLTILQHKFEDLKRDMAGKVVTWLDKINWDGIMKGAQNMWNALKPITDAMMSAFTAIGQYFVEHWLPDTMKIINALSPYLLEAIKIIGIVLGTTLVVALKAVGIAFNVLGVVIDVWTNAVVGYITFVKNAWGTVFNFMANVAKLLKPGFDAVYNIVVAPFKNAFDAVANLWNGTIGKLQWKVPDWVPGIGGHEIGAPKIPLLAEGGIVTKPTLAMIGEAGAEAVIPLKNAGSHGIGGNTTVNISINAQSFMGSQIQARQHAQAVFNALQDIAKSKNTTVAKMIGAA